jgi:hypothetical protein
MPEQSIVLPVSLHFFPRRVNAQMRIFRIFFRPRCYGPGRIRAARRVSVVKTAAFTPLTRRRNAPPGPGACRACRDKGLDIFYL